MSYLILLNEDGSTRIFKVDKPQVGLGFKDDNDVCIPVTGVSRHHARILNEGDHVFLEDLGSTNKTQIDGTAISKQEISHDTTFVLGKCVPVLYLDDIDHGAVSRFISNFSKDDSFETKLVQPYQQAEDREFKELVSLFEIASDIKSTHDLDTVLKSILDRVLILTGAQRGFVILIENGEFTVKLRRGRDVDELDPEALSMSVAQKAIETKTTQMFTRPAIGTISMPSSIEEYRINSLMCAPLVVKKQVIGCIYIDIRKSEAAFSDRDATLFTAMAHQAALAIDTSRMVLDQKHRLEEQEFLYEISRGLNVDEDMESLLKKCLDQIREVLGAERTSLMMYDPVTKCLQTRFVAGVDRIIDSPILLKLGEGIAGRVALQSKGILINGATDDERFKKILERDGNVNRIMCAPLVSMKACIGVINGPSPPLC